MKIETPPQISIAVHSRSLLLLCVIGERAPVQLRPFRASDALRLPTREHTKSLLLLPKTSSSETKKQDRQEDEGGHLGPLALGGCSGKAYKYSGASFGKKFTWGKFKKLQMNAESFCRLWRFVSNGFLCWHFSYYVRVVSMILQICWISSNINLKTAGPFSDGADDGGVGDLEDGAREDLRRAQFARVHRELLGRAQQVHTDRTFQVAFRKVLSCWGRSWSNSLIYNGFLLHQ